MARDFDCTLHILPEACVVAAAILLLIPLQWALAWIAAAICHELFHCLALVLCRKDIQEVVIGANGAEIRTGMLSNKESIVCTLAGPVGGFLLLLVLDTFPRLAICGFLQSLFNLIPIYPMDGGRALRGLIDLVLSERTAGMLCNIVEILFLVLIFLLGLFLTVFLKLGLSPVLIAVFFAIHIKKIKRPCK